MKMPAISSGFLVQTEEGGVYETKLAVQGAAFPLGPDG